MSDSGPGRREVAYRLFAAEFDDAEFSYSESDEERAPNYVVTPTGARVNRLFAVGVLTEVEDVNPEMVRGRVVDPTGAFVTYAGQYQPDELAFLERADPPMFLALSGKARTFEPDDGDRIYTSVRPESVSEVDAETRDRWVVTAAERTLERIGVAASAIESGLAGDRLREALEAEGVDSRLADGVALALDYYDTTPAYLEALRETALDAVRVVAGEIDEVGRLDVAPDEGSAAPEGSRDEGGDAAGAGDAAALATLDLSEPETPEAASASASGGVEAASEGDEAETAGATTDSPTTADPDVETGVDDETGTTAAAGAEPDVTTDAGDDPEAGAVSGTDPTPADADVETGADRESDAETGELEPDAATEAAAEPEPEATPDAAEAESTAEAVEGGGQEPGADADEEEEDLEDFDPGEFELDEEERREVEDEYGTDFSTADEVESGAGAADEEGGTPTEAELAERAPTEAEEASADAEMGAAPGDDPRTEADEGDEEDAEASAEEVVLEDAVMETMEELDDGDGAERDELVSTVADRYGALPEDVEDALQDALMSGRCYEPTDGVFKSI